MDLLTPLRVGSRVAVGAVKLAAAVPRAIIHEVAGDGDRQRHQAAGPPGATATAPPSSGPTAPAPGGTGRRAPSSRRTPGRASTPDGSVEVTKAPPEPTSAAGASGGVGGTAAAPGAAAAVGAPDPTAATAAEAQPIAPQGERRAIDVSPPARARPREATMPKRSEIDRRRVQEREAEPDTVVESEGSAAPAAQVRVDQPWEGYNRMKATEVVARARSADPALKAVIRLYEQQHKKRKSILDATGA